MSKSPTLARGAPCPPTPVAAVPPPLRRREPRTCKPRPEPHTAPEPCSGLALEAGASLSALAASCWRLRDIRRAAGAPRAVRLTLAVAQLASAARVEMSAALLAAQAAADGSDPRRQGALLAAISSGRSQHRLISDLASLCPRALLEEWHWSAFQASKLTSQLLLLIGSEPPLEDPWAPCPAPGAPSREGWSRVTSFPNGAGLFLSAIAHGWSWDAALHAMRGLSAGWLAPDGLTFVPEEGAPPPAGTVDEAVEAAPGLGDTALAGGCRSASFPFGGGSASIFASPSGVLLVRCTVRLCPAPGGLLKTCRMVRSCRPGRGDFPSGFAPECIRMPCTMEGGTSRILPPPPDTGAIVDFRDNWERLVGPLTGEVRAILNGLMHYPRVSHTARQSRKRNHPSFEDNPDAKRILGPKAAVWLYHAILECCPHTHPPAFIEPIGAVPKKPNSLRMINDGRAGNEDLGPWPVNYTTVRDVARSLAYGDFSAVSDFDDAYHACKKAGCSGRLGRERVLRVSPSGHAEWGWQTRVGCSPVTCSGTCDKARSGISFDGLLARFASSHFGEASAGSPLNALVMQLRRYFATRGPFASDGRVATAAWVDDMLLILKNVFHGLCGGLAAGCPSCAENKTLADQLEAHWIWLAPLLGFSLSTTKRQLAAQRWEYTGIILDTILGLFLLPDDKRARILADLATLFAAKTTTARALAEVAGRLLHYSISLRHVRPFIPLLWARIGSEDPKIDYDRVLQVDAEIQEACAFLLSTIPVYASAGAPLWPPVPSSVYGALCKGDPVLTPTFGVSGDASASGWSLGLQTPDHRGMRIFPQTWPVGAPCDVQTHREALGLCLALEMAALLVDLTDATVVIRNDCSAALSALRKGSTDSPFLQACAMRMTRLAAASNIDLLFLHVPGATLVQEGLDSASRTLAQLERGPACSPPLRSLIHGAARRHGWSLSIDLFACSENSLCDRFYSRFPDAAAEAVDALGVPCWDSSRCPSCGLDHREVSFAFPPRSLIPAFMAKAAADGIRAIVLVPAAVTEPYWPALMAASVTPGRGFDLVRRPDRLLLHSGKESFPALALFAVDFGTSRAPAAPLAPPCGGAGAARQRQPPARVLLDPGCPASLPAPGRLAAELAARDRH